MWPIYSELYTEKIATEKENANEISKLLILIFSF
jgi:hypothetical protein